MDLPNVVTMSDLLTSDDATLIDRSIGLEDGVVSEPTPPSIDAFDHEAGAERRDPAGTGVRCRG